MKQVSIFLGFQTCHLRLIGGSVTISSNGGDIVFESLDVSSALTLDVKNGNISDVIAGSYDDFAIQSEIKKVKAICRAIRTAVKKH